MKIRNLLAALAVAVSTLPAGATGEIESLITTPDRERLAAFDETRRVALDEARASGSAADRATLAEVVDRKPVSTDGFDMTGKWQCRTIKLGGAARLVVYGWFRCEVTDDGAGWTLEKISGSQRTFGRFFTESPTRMTYLGAFHVAGQERPRYGAGPESDQVGYALVTGPDAFRIEFPAPYYESKFDILELRR